ncbi:PREDICTED: odorant receptor 9a-like [Wasmannia auropunctata]|uniref:odorant receptor 9a-like n=1 Tax=Wasmannia auropunctata TaxID=64793 RepID=UPI0005EE9D14|nr:PREDICTED: odorant receptor 9a-like [Wasmannia auropunctata]
MIRKYAGDAKLYTIGFMILMVSSVLGFLIISYVPLILDVIVPMNVSRPRQTVIALEYFVDEETYFLAILTHIVITLYVGASTIASFASILIAYVLHTCAMFKIASHRIEHIFDEMQHMSKDIKQYILYNKLIHAVYIHRRAMDLANILTNSFATLYFVLLGFGVASTSFNILNLFNAIISLEKLDLLIFSDLIFLHLYYIFLGNYVGQNIIDNSIGVCQATYNARWYTAPVCMQKWILFIMQRSSRKSSLTAGGLFDASLEGFATLMSMSISYVMVLQSIGVHKESHEKNNNNHI